MKARRAIPLFFIWAMAACQASLGTSSGPAAQPTGPEQKQAAAEPVPVEAEEQADEQAELAARYGAAKVLSTQLGEASYYSDALTGRSTASGEPYEPAKFTAAHRNLPFGTIVRVTRKDSDQSVYVRINDRGPFGKRRRIIDLSRSAAEAIGLIGPGIADVKLEIVERPDARPLR